VSTIALDFDGVLADIHSVACAIYTARTGQRLTPDDLTDYYFPAWEAFGEIWHAPGFYATVEPMPGALLGLDKLRRAGHRVVIVTTCAPGMAEEKADWLFRHGSTPDSLSHPDFVACKDKTLIRADVLIEDSPANVVAWVKTNRRAILLNRPWTVKADIQSSLWTWITRAKDWSAIVAVLT